MRLILSVLCALVWTIVPGSMMAQRVIVIVNAANPVSTLSTRAISDIFLKAVTRWSEDKTIVPVDQARGTKVREVFSKAVHDRSAASITTYWQTQIFSGKNVPPITKNTDAAVLAFVGANPNAIGYIRADTPLGANVKAVVVQGL